MKDINPPPATQGRPSKYSASLCRLVIAYFEEGLCKTEVCARLRISTKTFNRWCEDHPEFNEAAELGLTLSEASAISTQKDYIQGKQKCSQPILHLNMMKNCYGWDKPEASNKNTINIENMQVNQLQQTDLDSKIRCLQEQLGRLGANLDDE